MGQYEKKLHSMTLKKWTKEIEDRFDIEADGESPTERIEDALEQLDEIISSGGSPEELRKFIRSSVIQWYKIGAKRGAAEMLKDLMWYEILPDDIDELKEMLDEPLSESDALLWSTVLKYKKHDSENGLVRATVKLPYKRIIKKLESLK
ncbi:hypothetical protein [Photobacterium leiognathi]|uniref:hypothetical protein n=1 Tax=Photobacterium leiognathi TaxID=553611 RepID=UPI0029826D4D|nr:hypothetical protein [Photobacterium leiognathi]